MIKNILEVITLNKLKLSIMFILTLIVSIGTVYVVYARVDIVDSVIYKTGSLWTKVGVIICILIIVELLRAWLKIIIAQLVKQWKIYLGDRISKNIETMSQSEFNKVDSGEHMTKYTYQLELLSAYLFSPLTGLLSAIVLFISSVVFLWLINWKFVVFALLSSIAMFLISGKFGNKISVGYTNLSILSGKFSGVLKEYLTGYEDLKNIGKINLFSKNVKASQIQKEDQQYSISKLMAFGELTLQSIEKLLELLIFIFAIYLVLKNELTIGTIASVSTILGIYLTSINQLVDLYIKVIGTKEILNSVITKATTQETIYPHVEKNIEFKDFNYSFGNNHVIKNFNFNINKGGKYAVIGKSGSGKSTIIKLLLGKLQSNQDKVLIDGNPLEIQDDINFSKEIGYVSQQSSIFSGSIRYNITLDDSYSDEEIWSILEKVCLADRVKALPDGLDHNLSNMGEILSGGEKQRLVLARVLIRNYPILILDEATSAKALARDYKNNLYLGNLMSDGTFQYIKDVVPTVGNGGLYGRTENETDVRNLRSAKSAEYKYFYITRLAKWVDGTNVIEYHKIVQRKPEYDYVAPVTVVTANALSFAKNTYQAATPEELVRRRHEAMLYVGNVMSDGTFQFIKELPANITESVKYGSAENVTDVNQLNDTGSATNKYAYNIKTVTWATTPATTISFVEARRPANDFSTAPTIVNDYALSFNRNSYEEVTLDKIKAKGVELEFVTLHVGLGTFRPVSAETIEDHEMHSEFFVVPQDTADRINAAKQKGSRIIAVGTTSVRTLESATNDDGVLQGMSGWTQIFIYPGYKFKMIDALVTNFHLPQSTLLMLISALAGREHCLAAYEEAVRERYRFFSFGDAMFIR